MQQWEYLTAIVSANNENPVVIKINEKSVAQRKQASPIDEVWIGENLWSFLARAGKDGWEAVTSNPATTGMEGWLGSWIIFFKRPIANI